MQQYNKGWGDKSKLSENYPKLKTKMNAKLYNPEQNTFMWTGYCWKLRWYLHETKMNGKLN